MEFTCQEEEVSALRNGMIKTGYVLINGPKVKVTYPRSETNGRRRMGTDDMSPRLRTVELADANHFSVGRT